MTGTVFVVVVVVDWYTVRREFCVWHSGTQFNFWGQVTHKQGHN